jgi:hypothetical protein
VAGSAINWSSRPQCAHPRALLFHPFAFLFHCLFSKPTLLAGVDLLAPGLLDPVLHTVGLPFGCPDIPTTLFSAVSTIPLSTRLPDGKLLPTAPVRARPPAAAPGCAEPLTTVTRTASSSAPSGHRTQQRPSPSAATLAGVTNLAFAPTNCAQGQTACLAGCDSRAGVEVQMVAGLRPTACLLAPIQYCQCCLQRGFAVEVFSEAL